MMWIVMCKNHDKAACKYLQAALNFYHQPNASLGQLMPLRQFATFAFFFEVFGFFDDDTRQS